MIPRSKVPRRFVSLHKIFPKQKSTSATQNGLPGAVSQAGLADQLKGAGTNLHVDGAARSLTADSARDQCSLVQAGSLSATGHHRPSMIHRRAFRASSRQAANVPQTSFQERTQIPTSSWSRPPQASQDADDNVVPTYYIERKRQRDAISERKEEEGGLMAELSAGILSDGVAARTRTREEKIPVEVRAADGTVSHPSGFEPPTPETEFHPAAAKVPEAEDPEAPVATMKQLWDERKFSVPADSTGTAPRIDKRLHKDILARVLKATVAQAKEGTKSTEPPRQVEEKSMFGASGAEEPSVRLADVSESSFEKRREIPVSAWDQPGRVRSGVRPREDVVPPYYIERKRQRNAVAEREAEEGGLMHELSEGILSDDLGAEMRVREEKIPVEVVAKDGSIIHPSGFVPPTPETEFHPIAAKPAQSPPKTPWTELPLRS